MRKAISNTHGALAWIAVAAITAQFFLAGLGIFGAASFQAHSINGYLIMLLSLVLMLLAFAGRLDRDRRNFSGLLFGLVIVQAILPKGPPLVAALHPLNALAVLGVAANLARMGLRRHDPFQPTDREHTLSGEPVV